MLINPNLPSETALAGRQSALPVAGAATSQTSSTATTASAASQLDPFLQRLADLPAETPDAQFGIQNEQGAQQSTEFLRQAMMGQPGMAMTAQANQISQNVLGLLQSTD
jgi:flagellin-like hook-associated protein FlgL